MTREDYLKIAAVIRNCPARVEKKDLVVRFLLMLELENPRFKPDKFVTACGGVLTKKEE